MRLPRPRCYTSTAVSRTAGSHNMKNPLDSLWGTVLIGLAMTVLLYYLARGMMGG